MPADEGEGDIPQDDAGDGRETQRREAKTPDEEDVFHAVVPPAEIPELQCKERHFSDEEEACRQHKEEEEHSIEAG